MNSSIFRLSEPCGGGGLPPRTTRKTRSDGSCGWSANRSDCPGSALASASETNNVRQIPRASRPLWQTASVRHLGRTVQCSGNRRRCRWRGSMERVLESFLRTVSVALASVERVQDRSLDPWFPMRKRWGSQIYRRVLRSSVLQLGAYSSVVWPRRATSRVRARRAGDRPPIGATEFIGKARDGIGASQTPG